MKNLKAVAVISATIKNKIAEAVNGISEAKMTSLLSAVDFNDGIKTVDAVAEMGELVKALVLSASDEELNKFPKFDFKPTVECYEDNGKVVVSGVNLVVKTPARNELPYKVSHRIVTKDAKELFDYFVEKATEFGNYLLYRQFAVENIAEVNAILDKIEDVPFKVKFAFTDKTHYIESITAEEVALSVDIDKAFALCDNPIICLDSENEYAKAQAEAYLSSIIAEIQKEQTTVKFLKSKSAFVESILGKCRKTAVGIIKETFNRDYKKMVKGIGGVTKEVNGVKVFALFEKVGEKGAVEDKVVLKPFNVDDLSYVDVDPQVLLAD